MNLLSWMLAVMAMGGLLGLAAWALEWLGARHQAPGRIGWGLALLLATVLPVLPLVFGSWTSVSTLAQDHKTEAGSIATPDLPPLAAPQTSWYTDIRGQIQGLFEGIGASTEWNRTLLWGWGGLSVMTLFVLALGPFHLARQRRSWEMIHLRGTKVYLAPKHGPLVFGVWRPRIVLPASYRALPATDLNMVIDHEEEHIRARDPALLALGMLPLVLFPWSPAVWWMFRRLRIALEVDCDRRVLGRGRRPAVYGDLLVRLRFSSPEAPIILHPLTLSARPSILERRLQAMIRSSSSPSVPVSLTGASLVLALVLLACATTPPIAPDASSAEGVTLPAGPPDSAQSGPVFTPFTVAPEVRNRAEVSAALNENYPEEFRRAGIGGTTLFYFFIDAQGQVQDVRIDRTSGSEVLDQAALRVARVLQFSPALNRDERVPVWVQIPITFTTR